MEILARGLLGFAGQGELAEKGGIRGLLEWHFRRRPLEPDVTAFRTKFIPSIAPCSPTAVDARYTPGLVRGIIGNIGHGPRVYVCDSRGTCTHSRLSNRSKRDFFPFLSSQA